MEAGDRISRPARLTLLAPAVLVIAVCLAGPLTLLLSYSFAPGGSTRANFSEGLTLENYVSVLGDTFYLGIILKTLCTLGVVAPLLISIPVRNYGWMVILGDTGLINKALLATGLIAQPLRMMFTDFAVVIGLTHVLMPFVVLSVLATLERIPGHLTEAARSLGAGRLTAIRLIVLPLSMPGLLAGATLVFCVAISSYVTPALMGPSGAKYSATLVYQQFVSVFDWPRGAAIAAVLLVITAAALVLVLGSANRRYRHLLRSH